MESINKRGKQGRRVVVLLGIQIGPILVVDLCLLGPQCGTWRPSGANERSLRGLCAEHLLLQVCELHLFMNSLVTPHDSLPTTLITV